jgi:hypothetical protein
VRSALIAILLVAGSAGCTQPRSARCKQVCTRESECVSTTSSQVPFDEKECVAACAVLEGDQDNLAKVERHAACVLKQTACSAVLECP